MALRALMIRKRLTDARKALDTLAAKDAEFESREADLEKSIDEVTTDEERQAVEEAIEQYEAEAAAHKEEKAGLERTIKELEDDLAAEEAEQDTTPPESGEQRSEEIPAGEDDKMVRTRFFENMNMQERSELFQREDVNGWLGEIRSCIREKRALGNVGLTIPEVMLGLLKQNVTEYSKLYKHVDVRAVSGDGRAVVMGTIPEAIWTDCCANLNELDLNFNDVELGCWKVGGFFAICNATLEDSDIDLASEVLAAIGQAIGRALDKAILYGTGTRMPLGIVTRLAQESQPASYPATARTWVDLHTSNIKTIANNVTGKDLFAQLVLNFGNAKGKYSKGGLVHVMNETTYAFLMSQAMAFDANGALVAGLQATMPVVGGAIEIVDDVPNYNIISGYFDLYLLAERAGQKFATSEHFKFLADQTVFKGTARYDGQPAIAEGFVVNAINSASASGSITFGPDESNEVNYVLLPTTAMVVSGEDIQLTAIIGPGTGSITWASATTGKATVSSSGLVHGVASGSSVISATCNGKTASCTVTVTTE